MALGLLGSYLSSSSEDDDDDYSKDLIEENKKKEEEELKLKSKSTPLLSNPFGSTTFRPGPSYSLEVHDLKPGSGEKSESSVFNNPFRAKEIREKAILERHVEMTSRQEEQKKSSIDGKKICWNFRKGRCRFGHKCTYAHDNDIKSSLQPSKEDESKEENSVNLAAASSGSSRPPEKKSAEQYDSAAVITGQSSQGGLKKKRPGLSDGLVPGKKAMKFFDKVYENK